MSRESFNHFESPSRRPEAPSRGDRKDEVNHDDPPFSRIFIICSKSHTVDDIKDKFQEFGNIEDVWIVKDKVTKQSRGVAYVKFKKMSQATLAVDGLDGKYLLDEDEKPLKVIIAQPKATKRTDDFDDETALTRLFITVPRDMEEKELKDNFTKFGEVEYTQIVKDKQTGDRKGFGYVKYKKPYHAALAVESADTIFRAIIAEPKASKHKRELEQDLGFSPGSDMRRADGFSRSAPYSSANVPSGVSNRLVVQVHPKLTRHELGPLFDLIPGMEFFDLKKDFHTGESRGIATVVYNSVGSAIYAREKLHGFQYPIGTKLIVMYSGEERDLPPVPAPRFASDDYHPREISEPSRIIDCNVKLPPPQPLESEDAPCAMRLFIVCVGSLPPTDRALTDVFCRFGNLIEVYLLSRKNCGYAKYASPESAREAIAVLNGAEVSGVRLKVMEAEPPRPQAETTRKRPRT